TPANDSSLNTTDVVVVLPASHPISARAQFFRIKVPKRSRKSHNGSEEKVRREKSLRVVAPQFACEPQREDRQRRRTRDEQRRRAEPVDREGTCEHADGLADENRRRENGDCGTARVR